MSKLYELKEALEGLFLAGADDEHSGSEMLELLEDVNYPALLDIISETAETLHTYSVYAGQPYRSKPLVEEKAFFLFPNVKTEGMKDGVLYMHSLELWLLSDMTFLVTSCFETGIPGRITNTFRTVKGMCPNACGMDIDFVTLADYLTVLPSLYQKLRVPIYEQ